MWIIIFFFYLAPNIATDITIEFIYVLVKQVNFTLKFLHLHSRHDGLPTEEGDTLAGAPAAWLGAPCFWLIELWYKVSG